MNEIAILYVLCIVIFVANAIMVYKSINKKCIKPVLLVLLFALKCVLLLLVQRINTNSFSIVLTDILIYILGTMAYGYTIYERIYCILIECGSFFTSYIYMLIIEHQCDLILELLIIYSISFMLNILFVFCIGIFNSKSIKTVIGLVITYLLSLFIIMIVGTFDKVNIYIGAGVEFIIVNVLFGIIIKMIIRVNNSENKQNLLNEQIAIYRNEIDVKNRYNNRIRSIEHDMNNHIISIQHMISENRNEEALNYINKVFNISNMQRKIIDTGNVEIDAILNSKFDDMSSCGITYSYNVMIPSDMSLNVMNIVIILGNLLDNSIEAVKRLKTDEILDTFADESTYVDKDITVELIYDRGLLDITISNITQKDMKDLYYDLGHDGLSLPADFKTSKQDTSKHGIGINNIVYIVHQNDGLMNVIRKDGRFITQISLFV